MSVMLTRLSATNINLLPLAFGSIPYNKRASLFQQYAVEQEQGLREVFTTILDGKVIAYGTLVWLSPYEPFLKQLIPEIKDLNVVVAYRRQGYATQLIRHFELMVQARGYSVIGIGVGVTPDYNAARSLYLSLGYVFDGAGIIPDEWGGAEYLTKKITSF